MSESSILRPRRCQRVGVLEPSIYEDHTFEQMYAPLAQVVGDIKELLILYLYHAFWAIWLGDGPWDAYVIGRK